MPTIPSSNVLRIALVLVALSAFAAACGDSDDPTDASSSSPTATASEPATTESTTDSAPATSLGEPETTVSATTRIAETVYGPVEIPAAPERVFALDEYAAANLLSVGIEPVGVFTPYDALVPQAILTDAGIELTDATFGQWNFEAIAALEPDLIVLIDTQNPAVTEQLSEIAPAVTLPFVAPWRDGLSALADVAPDPGVLDELEATLTTRLAEIAEQIEPGTTMSVLGSGPAFGTYSLGGDSPTSDLIVEAGWERPAPQQEPASFGAALILSPEVLGEHDGDVLVALDGDPQFYDVAELEALATYPSLPAVADGRVVTADGAIWFNSDPFSAFWVTEDLAAVAAGGSPATFDDLDERWEAYLELLG
ncbi:MAG: ABC transporter substrate-binding protein [Actinomycetota bacterium]